jgi:hypothetical protein
MMQDSRLLASLGVLRAEVERRLESAKNKVVPRTSYELRIPETEDLPISALESKPEFGANHPIELTITKSADTGAPGIHEPHTAQTATDHPHDNIRTFTIWSLQKVMHLLRIGPNKAP